MRKRENSNLIANYINMVIIINITFSENADTLISFVDENDNYTITLRSQEFFEWVEHAEALVDNFLRSILFCLDEYTQDTLITSMVLILKNN